MPSLETLLTFVALSVAVTLAPGPDNLMVLAQSLSRGVIAGIGIALGCALGCFTHTLWAAIGASAVLAASPTAFAALKLAGAAYLLWLGIQALRSNGASLGATSSARPLAWWRYVGRGFVANAINPKVALFFLAFLPQFTHPGAGSIGAQMVVLGSVFALQTVLVFATIAYAAGAIGQLISRRPGVGKWLDRCTGGIFIALAANLAWSGRAP